jgi:hypothetical protein
MLNTPAVTPTLHEHTKSITLTLSEQNIALLRKSLLRYKPRNPAEEAKRKSLLFMLKFASQSPEPPQA